MAKQDTLQRIKERYSDAAEAMREQHARMREDAEFSNPAAPKQWPAEALLARKGRPMLTFDKTNQFVAQVVNDMRQNKPQILCLPADGRADVAVAQKLNGIIRHIEYVSRAGIAYDTGGEHAVRMGLGWLRVIPQVMRPETNEQEIRILRIHDPLSCLLDTNSTEPDGSDAMWGTIGTTLTKLAFRHLYPKAKVESFDDDYGNGWFTGETVRVCEYLEVEESTENRLTVDLMGQQVHVTEDEYWARSQADGYKPMVVGQIETRKRIVKWIKATGADILEETEFPSQFLPLIPVMGHEMWIDGKRYLCGMVRRMMDAQRFHNYAISAAAESVALQPKAPFIAAQEAIEGREPEWKNANAGQPSVLTFNARDDQGQPLPAPQRSQPPVMSQGWSDLLGYSSQAMESAVGMFKDNLGERSNAISGRAIRARQQEGDTANFHFMDNLSRSIEQLGRVIVDMIPRIYDTARQARIVGEDGEQEFVQVDPKMPQAVKKQGNKVIAINPGVGSYDVRVKAGPSYTTQRQETAEELGNLIQSAPQLLPMIGDAWVKARDFPEAEKIAKRLKAMLPPQIQALEDEDSEIPPEAMQQINSLKQQIQELSQALEKAAEAADAKEIEKDKAEADMLIRGYEAVTNRMKAVPPITPEQVQAIAMQTVQQALMVPPIEPEDMQHAMAPEPPEQMPMQQPEPAEAGFFTPPDEGMQ